MEFSTSIMKRINSSGFKSFCSPLIYEQKILSLFLAIRVRKCIKKWMSEFSKKFQTFHARSYPSQAMKISRGKIEELRSFKREIEQVLPHG